MPREQFAEHDTVRLTKKIEYGSVKLRPNTTGVIRKINKKLLSKTEYVVRWSGTNFDMTMNGSSNFVLAQVIDSAEVHKG